MLPIYKMIVDESEGMDFMGIVQDPANMKSFIAFDKSDKKPRKVYFANDDKMILFGVAVATDIPIFRNDDINGKHYVYFDKAQTRKIGQKMLKSGYLHNLNFQHDESDVIEDGQLDQIFYIDKEFGVNVEAFKDMHLKDGSMVVSYKFHTKEAWSRIKKGIADGSIGGLSIEGWFDKQEVNIKRVEMSSAKGTYLYDFESEGVSMCGRIDAKNAEDAATLAKELHGFEVEILGRLEEEVQYNKTNKMKKQSLWKKVFGEDKAEETNFAEAETVDGVVVMWEGDLAEGVAVFIMDDEGNQLQAPEGSHALLKEDGGQTVITVDGNGLITAIEEVAAEEPAEEEEIEEVEEEMSEADFKELIDSLFKKETERFDAFAKEQKTAFEKMSAENAELKANNLTLENQLKSLITELDNPEKFMKRKEEMEKEETPKKTYKDIIYNK